MIYKVTTSFSSLARYKFIFSIQSLRNGLNVIISVLEKTTQCFYFFFSIIYEEDWLSITPVGKGNNLCAPF